MRSHEHTVLGAILDVANLDHIESESARAVALPSLSTGTSITIHTRNTCYRMQVLDGTNRRVLITGGLLFPEGAEVEVIGAADDEHVRVGWMVEGLQLELSTDRGPVLTSLIESISVDRSTGRSSSLTNESQG